MFEQSPFLVPPYSALADIYDRAGFADYARDHVMNYVTYAQTMDWVGRRVLDLCDLDSRRTEQVILPRHG